MKCGDVPGTFAEYVALANQINANAIYAPWRSGTTCVAITDPDRGSKCTELGLPDFHRVSFNSNGDVDRTIQISTDISIDWATHNASAVMDISITAIIGYVAQTGATTYSGSGVFTPGQDHRCGPSRRTRAWTECDLPVCGHWPRLASSAW